MRIAAPLLLIATVGCDAPPAVFGDVLPDQRLLIDEAELVPVGATEASSSWATWLLDEARASNRRHVELVLLVEAITVLPSNYRDRGSEEAALWGPWIVDGSASQLWVERAGGDAYEWSIERQTVDADRVRFEDDAWQADLTGSIEAFGPNRTSGRLVVDVDEVGLGIIDSAADALGDEAAVPEVDDSADLGPVGRAALEYRLQRGGATFTTYGDVRGTVVPDSGGVTFDHVTGQGGTARATLDGNRNATVQWAAAGGGRADVVHNESGQTHSECWAADHKVVWSSDGTGDPNACAFAAAED